ncbi:unnamed protein product, partial [Oppiella nova]
MSYLRLSYTAMGTLGRIITKTSQRCKSQRRLDGRVVVVTGANSGLGRETVLQLSLRGAKVIMGCRSAETGEKAMNDILLRNGRADLIVLQVDLSSLNSVRYFAEMVAQKVNRLDILVNNAGVMNTPEWTTADGFENHFGTNHLGHFLLTMHLLPMLTKSPIGRVVTVSSMDHMAGKIHLDNINLRNGTYKPFKAYAQSKLANILFTREMARRLGPYSRVKTYSLFPGIVATNIGRHADLGAVGERVAQTVFLSPEMGVQTTLYCCLDEHLDDESGFYYANCQRVDDMLPTATDDKTAGALWQLSSISEVTRNVTKRTKRYQGNRRLDGQVVLITGANTGIGKETAYQLSLRGAKVIMSSRSLERGEAAMADIKLRNGRADLIVIQLDLASLKSVREFVQIVGIQVDRIDVLINNAGVMNTPEWTTTDGFEMQFGTNHL